MRHLACLLYLLYSSTLLAQSPTLQEQAQAAGNDPSLSSSLHTLHTHNGSAMVVIRPFKAIGTIRLTVRPEEIDAKDIAIKITP